MNVDLIFEGGGVLGLSFVGAYQALQNSGFIIKRCGGTSAGAIIAALITAGYSPDELERIIKNTNYKQFMRKNNIGKVPLIGRPLSLFVHNGMYDSYYIELWINSLLRDKGIEFFEDVMVNGESKLKIIASDITRRKMLILPDDLIDYGFDPSKFSIAKAVRMSCNIPLFFIPVKLKYKNTNSLIVDGGLLSNYPIWLFDGDSRWPTIGLKIKDLESNSYQGKTGFLSYIKDLLNTTTNRDETNFINHHDLVRTIIIDHNEKIDANDFTIEKEQIDHLYTNGYNSTIKYLNTKDFITDLRSNWIKIVKENL